VLRELLCTLNPEEVDEEFDFEESMREIHVEQEGLNKDAQRLDGIIAKNFLGYEV